MKTKGMFILVAIIAFSAILWGFVLRDDITYATAVGTVKVTGTLNVRKGPGKGYSYVKVNGKKAALKNDQQVTIHAKNKSWYKITCKYQGEKISGYVAGKYLTVLSGDVCTKVTGKISEKPILVRTMAVKSGCVLKDGDTAVKLAPKKQVRIITETILYGEKWYHIGFLYKQKNLTGYVPARYVTANYDSALPGLVVTSGKAILKKTAGKTTPVYDGKSAVVLADGNQVLMTGEKTVDDVKYIRVELEKNGKKFCGYVTANLLRIQQVEIEAVVTPSPEPIADQPVMTAKPTAKPMSLPGVDGTTTNSQQQAETEVVAKTLSEKEFKQEMLSEGFPSSYIALLMPLHKLYPKWQFKAYRTGIDWTEAVTKESAVGLNLITNAKADAWKSQAPGAYNSTTHTYIPFDGSSWVTASEEAVKYYMDPRNFMDAEKIFQFESLEYHSGIQNQTGVETVLNNTPMSNTTFTYTDSNGTEQTIKYSQAFMDAAVSSGVNPYHLASRVKQEVVTGPTSFSSSATGNVSGYTGIYNFYNIGANNSTKAGGAVANGLSWASKDTTYCRPWNDRYKAIVGGAQYLGSNYISVGQNTMYLQKFNVTSTNTFDHQYMANIEAPMSESIKAVSAYGTEKQNMSLIFSIPVYTGMPAYACAAPSGTTTEKIKSSNNLLKSLKIKGRKLKTPFVKGDDGTKIYKLSVGKKVSSVTIVAKAQDSTAVVKGSGTRNVKKGTHTFKIKVVAEDQTERSYKIKITRKK